jgi:hypothetical protein
LYFLRHLSFNHDPIIGFSRLPIPAIHRRIKDIVQTQRLGVQCIPAWPRLGFYRSFVNRVVPQPGHLTDGLMEN